MEAGIDLPRVRTDSVRFGTEGIDTRRCLQARLELKRRAENWARLQGHALELS